MNKNFYMPPEWAPHEATWITWPKDPITWPDRVEQAQDVYLQMMEMLSPHEKVNLLVDDEETKQDVLHRLTKRRNVQTKRAASSKGGLASGWSSTPTNISIYTIPTADSWIRDYGPIFVKPVGALLAEPWAPLQILDFIFNAWGNKYESLKKDDTIPQKISPLLNIPFLEPGIVLEGGSIDVNGKGTVLTTEQCLLNKNRNPHLSKNEIEETLKKYLGVNQILWLGDGIEGDDTDGHIDDITRFVSENKIITAVEEDPNDPNHLPLQENLKRLQTMNNPEGKPYQIIPIPMPGRLEREDGSRLPASYANFYIANQVVLVPIYQHKNDRAALEAIQNVFPERKVIGLDCRDLIYGMGALHCLTQQQPSL